MGQTTEQYLDGWQGLRVLVIGEAMLDSYWWGRARRLSPEAPVPVVDFLKQEEVPGGAANVAANLSNLGAIPIFLSAIAADAEGIRLKQVLEHHQVSPEFLVVAASRRTLAKQRVIGDAQILVRLDRGSTETLDFPTETALCASLEAQFPTCDAVIISDYGYGILTPTVIATLAKLQSQTPRPLIADAKNFAPYRSAGLTAIKPNYEQAIALLNLPKLSGSERLAQIEANGDNLLKIAGVNWAAVTLDIDGAIRPV
ncbi:MAG: D-glycero-beta-D-manno-heptose 1-phosphate adenylyltransferase, partial [Chloroflexaceae bacterium]|nr:D-glycero-beta-D-manno-heptose 1-phosphate adenylyltransferase [Chloroflexaceae bacterium]